MSPKLSRIMNIATVSNYLNLMRQAYFENAKSIDKAGDTIAKKTESFINFDVRRSKND